MSAKRYRYTGKEKDEETGLYYHGARYYAAWLGRWMGADPIGLGDGPNRYAYVHGNPVRGRDPTGMDTVSEVEHFMGYDEQSDPNDPLAGLDEVSDTSRGASQVGFVGTVPELPRTVTRWTKPSVDPAPTVRGMRPQHPTSTLRPADHALNEHQGGPTPYKSASERLLGSKTISPQERAVSSRYWIDIDRLPEGTEVIGPQELRADMLAKVEAQAQARARVEIWLRNQGPRGAEQEVLIRGWIPGRAVYGPSAMAAKGVGLLGGAIGTATTAYSLHESLMEGGRVGSPDPYMAERLRQAGGWGGALAGAKAAAALAAGTTWETGPAYPWLVLAAGAAGSVAGYQGADLFADYIYPN